MQPDRKWAGIPLLAPSSFLRRKGPEREALRRRPACSLASAPHWTLNECLATPVLEGLHRARFNRSDPARSSPKALPL